MIQKRNQIHNKEKRSMQIIQKLMESDDYKQANIVLGYSSIGSEVKTEQLLQCILYEQKLLYLPRVIDCKNATMEFYKVVDLDDLEVGYQGILEPYPTIPFSLEVKPTSREEQDYNVLIVVPGVAFDNKKMRMGYGMGYYDRYLTKIQIANSNVSNIKYIMLAYIEQKVDYLPHENTDIFMHKIITG